MSLKSLASKKGKNSDAQQSKVRKTQLRDRLLAWLPMYILIGFLLVGWLLFGNLILPGKQVEVANVLTRKANPEEQSVSTSASTSDARIPVDSFDGQVLFQASGWIEADPLPIRATALLDGVVDEVFVLEGQEVKKGQAIAKLIDDDARIALLEAQARLSEAEAEARREETHVRQIETQLETHALKITTLEYELKILQDEVDRLGGADKGIFPEREVQQSRLRLNAGQARMAELLSEGNELRNLVEIQQQAFSRALSSVEVARAKIKRAELDLSRTVISSPIDGIVQELFASPGRKRMLGMDNPESATIAKLYRSDSLQVRIDVPLVDASQLFIDQPVIVRSNLLPDRELRGYVTRIVGMADIQRNTLQAKVALLDPDSRLRPEMLCRAEFLASQRQINGNQNPTSQSAGRVQIYVPENAFVERTDDQAVVYSLDVTGEIVEQRRIRISTQTNEGFVLVMEGLNPGDPVIINPPEDLEPGDRVRPEFL